MYTVKFTNRFQKSYRLMARQGKDLSLLDDVIKLLMTGQPLDPKYNDHQLIGNFRKFRECHIKPDWLLIYLIEKDVLILTLIDTGSHSGILKKG